MPYKHIELKIPRKYDNRVKLEDYERREIKKLYGKISQRKLAKIYKVSRSLIRWIGDPEKYEHNKEIMKFNRFLNNNYYDKDKQREYMKKHRHYKQELYLKGKLEE